MCKCEKCKNKKENETYPQIVLGTDGLYQIFLSKGVEIKFETPEAINEFITKNPYFTIKGVKEDRLNDIRSEDLSLVWDVLDSIK